MKNSAIETISRKLIEKHLKQWSIESLFSETELIKMQDLGLNQAKWQQWWDENKGEIFKDR